jgi:hypothetical protein
VSTKWAAIAAPRTAASRRRAASQSLARCIWTAPISPAPMGPSQSRINQKPLGKIECPYMAERSFAEQVLVEPEHEVEYMYKSSIAPRVPFHIAERAGVEQHNNFPAAGLVSWGWPLQCHTLSLAQEIINFRAPYFVPHSVPSRLSTKASLHGTTHVPCQPDVGSGQDGQSTISNVGISPSRASIQQLVNTVFDYGMPRLEHTAGLAAQPAVRNIPTAVPSRTATASV